jgi:hypothetical protein
MQWSKLFRNETPTSDIWAALCEARADGSDPNRPNGVRYPLLVMVRSSQEALEATVLALLKTYGWHDPRVTRLRKVAQPFHSDDSMMRACYEGATQRDGGIVVYADPIEDA